MGTWISILCCHLVVNTQNDLSDVVQFSGYCPQKLCPLFSPLSSHRWMVALDNGYFTFNKQLMSLLTIY